MSAAENIRFSYYQQSNGVVRLLATLVIIVMLAGVAYLMLLRDEATMPGGAATIDPKSADSQQTGNKDSSDDAPLTPQQLMTLKPLASNADKALAGSNVITGVRSPSGAHFTNSADGAATQQAMANGQSVAPGAATGRMSDSAALAMTSGTGAKRVKPLPSLNNSDGEIRKVLVSLDSTLLLADWLVDEELIRKFVVMVDNMAAGNIPRKHSVIQPLNTTFRALEQGDKLYLDGYNFGRYAPYVDILASMDASQVSTLYQRYYPLMQRAYGELGYPRKSFHKRLLMAMGHVLDSPVREGSIELERPSVMFKYADPQLEQLSDVHKQMLRMGPENTRKLINRLTVLRSTLVRFGHG